MSHFQVNISGRSDIGRVRVENEDAMDWYISPHSPLSITVVADGMGGYEGGSTASQLACNVIIEQLKALEYQELHCRSQDEQQYVIEQYIHYAIEQANQTILEEKSQSPKLAKMGTTIVLLVCWDNLAILANIGDSRIYYYTNHKLKQITKDHSLVQELIDSGIINAQQARESEQKNQLLKALGVEQDCRAAIYTLQIQQHALFLLCSDGLTGLLEDHEISHYIDQNDATLETCYQLIEQANSRGGNDNITVAIVELSPS